MITSTLKSWLETTKELVTNPRALAIFAGLYALLLATLYGFVSTREATVWQVVVTLSFLVLIPAEFFIVQSAILRRALDRKFHWPQILRDSIKIAVVTLPAILIGYALFTWLNKWAAHYPAQTAPLSVWPSPKILTAPDKTIVPPLHWPTIWFATARYLIFGVVLPLATIHLWIEVSSRELHTLFDGGARGVLNRLGRAMARAFASPSVFIYALGLILFALIPYAILSLNVLPKGTKSDFAIFMGQLLLAFGFTLFGWIVTISAFARVSTETEPVSRGEMPVPAQAAA
jgi:hypothetical protein